MSGRQPGVRWRARTLTGEAARNFVSDRKRTVPLLLVSAGLLIGSALATGTKADEVVVAASRQEQAGASVRVLSLPAPLPAAGCDGFAGQAGVLAAGGVEDRGAYRTAAGVQFRLVAASGTAVRAIDPTAPVDVTVAVGVQAAVELGLGPERSRDRLAGPITLSPAGVIDFSRAAVIDTQRRGELERAIIVQEPLETVSTCIVAFAPWAATEGGDRLEAWAAAEGASLDRLHAVSVLPDDDLRADPTTVWETRVERWGWGAAAFVIAAFSVLSARTRRAEFALYRTLGAGRADVALLAGGECALVVAPGAAAALLLNVSAANAAATAAFDTISAAVSAVLLVAVVALLGRRRDVLSQLKDR